MASAIKVGYPDATMGDLADIDTTQRNPLGCRAMDKNGNEYVYLQGVASLAAGDFVVYNSAVITWVPIRLVTTAAVAGPVAVAMSANITAANFSWYQIYGQVAVANIATTAGTAGLMLFTSATAGRASGATGAATAIFNASISVTSAANVGSAFFAYPFTTGMATL